jgi:hypothetical protein
MIARPPNPTEDDRPFRSIFLWRDLALQDQLARGRSIVSRSSSVLRERADLLRDVDEFSLETSGKPQLEAATGQILLVLELNETDSIAVSMQLRHARREIQTQLRVAC